MDDATTRTDLTIPAVLARAVARHGNADALVDEGVQLSWTQLGAAVDAVAASLIASRVAAGDRIGIWAPNSAAWVIVALAAYRAGAIVVTVNTRFKGREAAHVLGTAGVRLLFTVTDFLDTDYVALLRDAPPLPALREIVVLAGPRREGTVDWDAFRARGAEVDAAAVAARSDTLAPDATANIVFTSGTTGAPKGAMLSHGSAVRSMRAWNERIGMRAGDRYLIMNPFFHTFGLNGGILSCLLAGATMIPHAVFDLPTLLARIAAERVTVFPGPPTIYQTLLDHPERARHDTSSLRLAVTGAAAVPVEMVRRMREELGFSTVVTAYGLTESNGLVTLCRHDDPPEVIAHTAGSPLPGLEVRIVDVGGHDVARGEPGEIRVRGYTLMQGYFGDPAATATAIDADGFLHTGDIGLQDAAGNLRITDRRKDMFIVGGFNAYPAEIENLMMDHPALSQVAVIGIPDARLGEVGMAWVVTRPGVDVAADELIAWCRERMANYKVPRRVAFVDAFPLNATGKVLKFRLREMAGMI